MTDRLTSPNAALEPLLGELRSGRTIYIPGASGEILSLASALRNEPERATGVHFIGCLIPGINETIDYAGLASGCRATTYLLPRCMRQSFANGRVALLPLTYYGAARHLIGTKIDVAFAHVTPPDDTGLCSLGIASDFATLAWQAARRKVLIVNPSMPRLPRALTLPIGEADLVVMIDGPVIETPEPDIDPVTMQIAERAASLIPNKAQIQTGIGGAPGAIWHYLTNHRALTLRSGMANEWVRTLSDAGALAATGDHTAGIAYGSRSFYEWLRETDMVRFASTLETHSVPALAQIPLLHSVNGALEIDLFGQANVEWQGNSLASGVGGGPDFMRSAAYSQGGRSIIALPSTANQGTTSRIVARLDRPTTGIARSDIDTVVTEHGIAELQDKGMDERADALISIAAPEFRGALADDWHDFRSSLQF